MKYLPLILPAIILCQSCIVSKKKYDDILAQKVKADGELVEKSDELKRVNGELSEANTLVTQLKGDTLDLGEELRANRQKLADVNGEFDQLNAYYKNLLTSSGKTNRELLAIQSNLERTRKRNDSLSESLMEREKKVEELEAILSNKDKAVTELKNTISNALLGFKESDLTVNVKNGKVYVSLTEQLLFGSGSVEVDKKGVSALQQLARAIKDHKDLQILVEGHTDNVPVSKKSQYMQDNWDLSVMRATAIVRILTSAGLPPTQVTASGRGEYIPLTGNTTAQEKQKNRRIEIIIAPNLDEVFRLLETN